MTKTITTGTEIIFVKTGEKFELTKTDTGFDVRPIKLSKNIVAEDYTFQQFLTLYESKLITVDGFEEADSDLIKAIITNYIHNTEIASLKTTIISHEAVNAELGETQTSLLAEIEQLKSDKQSLEEEKSALDTRLEKQDTEITKLNEALAAMQED